MEITNVRKSCAYCYSLEVELLTNCPQCGAPYGRIDVEIKITKQNVGGKITVYNNNYDNNYDRVFVYENESGIVKSVRLTTNTIREWFEKSGNIDCHVQLCRFLVNSLGIEPSSVYDLLMSAEIIG